MKAKKIQEFRGTINEIEINNESIFLSIQWLIETMEDKFKLDIKNKSFVNDLSETIKELWMKYDNFSYDKLEQDFYQCIEKADKIENLKFKYSDSEWKIENLNKKMSIYNFDKE